MLNMDNYKASAQWAIFLGPCINKLVLTDSLFNLKSGCGHRLPRLQRTQDRSLHDWHTSGAC